MTARSQAFLVRACLSRQSLRRARHAVRLPAAPLERAAMHELGSSAIRTYLGQLFQKVEPTSSGLLMRNAPWPM